MEAPHLASGDRCLEELGAFVVGRAVHALHILEVQARASPVVFIAIDTHGTGLDVRVVTE